MCAKNKIVLLMVLAAFGVLCCCARAQAAWWDKGLPLPPDTEKVNEETMAIGGAQTGLKYYASDLDTQEVKDFYLRELPRQGWEESPIMNYFPAADAPGTDAELAKQTKAFIRNNLVYENDQEYLFITIMPQEAFRDKKTRFTLSQWQKEALTKPSNQTLPELVAKPKKDVAPVYPKAYLTNLVEDAGFMDAMYVSEESNLLDVAAFYKDNMPSYGWSLSKEVPIHEATYKDLNNTFFKRDCPTCKKASEMGIENQPVSLDMQIAELVFANPKGDVCQVVVSHGKTPGAKGSQDVTMISVHYEEKK